MWTLALRGGASAAVVAAEWCDAFGVVTRGRVQLELRDGEPGPVLGRGAGFWLRGTGVRALRNPGRRTSRKKSRKSAEYTTSGFRFRDGRLTLAKMAEPLDIVWSRPLPEGAKPSTVTVAQDSAGRWFVSMLCDDPTVKPLPVTDAAVGVDVGLNHLLTLSTGEKIANPRHERT
ncbi:RNA-guided endonuclease InsQ/TnpB family protein, partial [Streptomyces atratus]|uniref:RNA-guided endonuclease InsQ/TnpB family protein n=1 Tax=Streptomyces atratus TaxID=1893 RepID=UPI0033D05FF6